MDRKVKYDAADIRIVAEPTMTGLRCADLRDDTGKLQGRWYPDVGVLEIQRRGVKTRYWLSRVELSR